MHTKLKIDNVTIFKRAVFQIKIKNIYNACNHGFIQKCHQKLEKKINLNSFYDINNIEKKFIL